MRALLITIAAASLVVIIALACAPVRQATYPEDFGYVPRAEVRDTMRAMAIQVAALDDALRDEQLAELDKQERVVQLLLAIDGSASSLEGRGAATNHPILDENLGHFLSDVRAARDAATREPPSYFLAGSVSGACRYCHGPR